MHAVYGIYTQGGGNLTLPDERYRALLQAERLLQDLTDCRETPRVPMAIRARARQALRHYPGAYYIEELARRAPDIITPELEELTRWVVSNTVEEQDPAAK